jgi:hypothetical protein
MHLELLDTGQGGMMRLNSKLTGERTIDDYERHHSKDTLPLPQYYQTHTSPSSLARTQRMLVRISLKAWTFVVCMRLFCVCVVLCVGSGLATG